LVGVAYLPCGEAGRKILCQIGAVALVHLRFQLQRFDRVDAGEIFGEKGLVARAEQELAVEPATKDGNHDETRQRDEQNQTDRDQGELP